MMSPSRLQSSHHRDVGARPHRHRLTLIALVLLLLTSGCGDAFFNLDIVNHRQEPVVVALSDAEGPRMSVDVEPCKGRSLDAIAYAPGEVITVTVFAGPSHASLLSRTLSPKSTPGAGLPSLTLEVPAAAEGECVNSAGRSTTSAGGWF